MASWLFKSKSSLARSNSDNGKGFASTRIFSLRQSRWFTRAESNLFKNVLDSGSILERRATKNDDGRIVDKDAESTLEYGIVLWIDQPEGKEKQAMIVHLDAPNGKKQNAERGIKYCRLEDFWLDSTEIRIHNLSDNTQKPNSPEEIVDLINRALRGSYKWKDSVRFVHWCRYGNPTPAAGEIIRKRQLSDAAICWGSISASAGALFYTTRRQRQHSGRTG